MIRRAVIRNQARKESYLRERREGKKWSDLPKVDWSTLLDMMVASKDELKTDESKYKKALEGFYFNINN